jgi:hypothetical protein
MTQTSETPPGMAGLADPSFSSENVRESAPNSAPNQVNLLRSPAAVAAARRELRLEFLHERAGGIRIHAELAQTFAEIGDTAGVSYAFRRLFAHVKAHPVFVELREEAGQ